MQSPGHPDPARSVTLPAVTDRETVARILPDLRDALAAGSMVLDGQSVERIGQSGLQLLISARRSADAQGANLALVSPSAALCRAAQLAGVADALALPEID